MPAKKIKAIPQPRRRRRVQEVDVNIIGLQEHWADQKKMFNTMVKLLKTVLENSDSEAIRNATKNVDKVASDLTDAEK